MFVYHLVVYKSVINAFNPEEELDRVRFDVGYFTNKWKSNKAFVDLCDEEIVWLLVCGEKIEVGTDYPNKLKTRIEKKGEIIWLVGTIEKITVR